MSFSYENISEICRLCLLKCASTISIYTKLTDTALLDIQNASTLGEELEEITSISIDPCDGLPSLVCSNCVSLIHTAYKFKKQFDYSHGLLQKYLLDCEDTKDIIYNEVNIEDDADDMDYDSGIHLSNQNDKVLSKKKTEQEEIRMHVKIKSDTETETESEEETVDSNSPVLHPCPFCKLKFSSSDLINHAKTHQTLKRYLNCGIEQNAFHIPRFYKENDLMKQIDSIHNRKEKLHQCVFCHSKMSASKLRIHVAKHKNDNSSHVFNKLHHLKTRTDEVHFKDFPFECDTCGKAFSTISNYERHVLGHHAKHHTKYPCKTCNKVFSYASGLDNHINNVHKLKGAKTLCAACGKYVTDLSAHKKEHYS